MFTSIMNGVINEVTRHPAGVPMLQQGRSTSEVARPTGKPQRRRARTAPVARARIALPGKYRVLADSFKRAAGFC
jgi:hypothetical protein